MVSQVSTRIRIGRVECRPDGADRLVLGDEGVQWNEVWFIQSI